MLFYSLMPQMYLIPLRPRKIDYGNSVTRAHQQKMLRVFFFILENAPFLFYIHHKVKKDIIIILGHVLLTTIHLQTKVID